MSYREPTPRDNEQIDDDLASTDVATVQRALIDGAHFLDCGWLQERALVLTEDPRPEIRRTSVVALAVLARRRCLETGPAFWMAVQRLRADPGVAGVVDDLIDDVGTYDASASP